MVDEVFSSTDISHTCPQSVAQVLGVGLMPVSIWHVWILKALENPFAVGGIPKAQDLAQAVLVCSNDRKSFGEIMSDDDTLTDKIADLAQAWYEVDDISSHIRSFHLYVEQGVSGPEFWEDPKTDAVKDRQRCPVEWHLVYMLLNNKVCHTEEEAWNYPFNRAVCWSAVVGEQNGSRNYIDQVDREQIKKVNL